MTPLSVVIITYNEAHNIARCIDAIKEIADDILVVDSYSGDDTVKIARSKGARIIENQFEGYIEQKSFANNNAIYPHILSLDADEFPDEVFLNEIKKIKEHWDADGYVVNRLNNYCGKWIKHGAWYPDKKLRLYDSRKGHWEGINPHDRFALADGARSRYLSGNLLHYSYSNIAQHLARSYKYATIGAESYHLKGRKSSWFKIIFSPLFRFMRDYIFRRGFMDGYYGLVIAFINSREVFIKYTTLYKMQ